VNRIEIAYELKYNTKFFGWKHKGLF
jgi:hypothetical protein